MEDISIISNLLKLDRELLFYLNIDLASPLVDLIMILLSSPLPWIVLSLSILWLYWQTKKFNYIKIFLCCGLTVAIADFFTYNVLKLNIERLRPCKEFEFLRAIDGCASLYGFPSNHATNAMAIAVVILHTMSPKFSLIVLLSALMVGISRVFVGVHYPSDVAFGFLNGIFWGHLFVFLGATYFNLETRLLFKVRQ